MEPKNHDIWTALSMAYGNKAEMGNFSIQESTDHHGHFFGMFGNYPTLLRGSGRLEKVIWQAYLTSTPKSLVVASLKVFPEIRLRDIVWRGSAMWRLSPL